MCAYKTLNIFEISTLTICNNQYVATLEVLIILLKQIESLYFEMNEYMYSIGNWLFMGKKFVFVFFNLIWKSKTIVFLFLEKVT